MRRPRARTRVRGAVGALTVGVAGAAVGFAVPAQAVSAIQSGYWWELQPDGAPLPAPAQVPEGGLYVASNAAGPLAVSAIRLTLADGETAPILTLKVSQAQPADQVSIVGCPAASKWTPPAGAGAWSARPAADCAKGQVTGALSADGKTLEVDLSLLGGDSPTIDVVLMPSAVSDPVGGTVPGAPASIPASFDATFQPVTAAQVDVLGGASPAPPTSGTGPTPGVPTTGAGTASLPPGFTANGGPADLAGDALAGAALAPALPTVPGGGQSPAVAGRSGPAGEQFAASQPVVTTTAGDLSPRERLVLALLVVNLLVFLYVQNQRRDASGVRPRLTLYDAPPPREAAE